GGRRRPGGSGRRPPGGGGGSGGKSGPESPPRPLKTPRGGSSPFLFFFRVCARVRRPPCVVLSGARRVGALCSSSGGAAPGVRRVPPVRAAGLRLLVGAVALIGLALIQRAPWPQKAREWIFVTILSFTMMGVPFGLVFWAEQFVTSSMTAVFYATTPLFVAL